MTPIANNEAGSSVRAKLNKLMGLVSGLMAVKTAQEVRSTNVKSDDADLVVAVEAGVKYLVSFSLLFSPSDPSDYPSVSWTLPALTGSVQTLWKHIVTGVVPAVSYTVDVSASTFTATYHNGYNVIEGWMRITPSASGNIKVKWACGSSGNAIMEAGSWISLVETK